MTNQLIKQRSAFLSNADSLLKQKLPSPPGGGFSKQKKFVAWSNRSPPTIPSSPLHLALLGNINNKLEDEERGWWGGAGGLTKKAECIEQSCVSVTGLLNSCPGWDGACRERQRVAALGVGECVAAVLCLGPYSVDERKGTGCCAVSRTLLSRWGEGDWLLCCV